MRIVVTAGPTREPIDPIRYLSNRSSGKMGYALAEAGLAAGHDVTLITGPTCLTPPAAARLIAVTTSDEMYDAVQTAVKNCDLFVMCAAVADYKPAKSATRKLEKHGGPFSLELTPTRDILASVATGERSYFVVGFAAQTHEVEARARQKLLTKNCDMIVANDVSRTDVGMESDDNAVTIFLRDGESKAIARAPKAIIAREILKIVFTMHQKSLTKKS